MNDISLSPEWLALLRGIRECPDCDLARLVAADWLDEHGGCERAEFIRVQVDLAKTSGPKQIAEGLFKPHWFGESWAILHVGETEEDSTSTHHDVAHGFVTRGFVSHVWLTADRFLGGECRFCEGAGDERVLGFREPCEECGGKWEPGGGPVSFPQQFQHGRYTPGTGRTPGLARELFERHPIEQVTLTDRHPMMFHANGSPWAWFCGDSNLKSDLPREIFDLLEGSFGATDRPELKCRIYHTHELALVALSRACVRFGRRLVGLPDMVMQEVVA